MLDDSRAKTAIEMNMGMPVGPSLPEEGSSAMEDRKPDVSFEYHISALHGMLQVNVEQGARDWVK